MHDLLDRKLLDRACNSMRRRNEKEMEDAMKKRGSVGVHTMSAMLEKHSGISAAPTVQRARLDRRSARLAHFTCHHCAPIAFTYAFNFCSIIPSTRPYIPPSLSLSLQFFSFVIVRYNGQVNNAPKIRWRVKATFVERSVEMVVSKVVNMFRKCDIERTSISCIEIFGSILISYLEKYFPARLFLRLGITGVTISPLLNRSVFRKDFASAGHEPMTVRFITYCIECRSYNTVIM